MTNQLSSSIGQPLLVALAAIVVVGSASLMPVPFAQAVGTGEVPSASEILRQVEDEGSRAVLRRLWSAPDVFEKLCSRIASGRSDWLEVAKALKSGADAAASLSLNYAVARALPVAPARVLALVGQGFAVTDICTSPFVEPERGVAEQYRLQAIDALRKPFSPQLEKAREECLQHLRAPLGSEAAPPRSN